MKIRADLRCMTCCHYLGEVVAHRTRQAVDLDRFAPGPMFRGIRGLIPRRCDKCGGRLYLDEVEFVRPKPVAAAA